MVNCPQCPFFYDNMVSSSGRRKTKLHTFSNKRDNMAAVITSLLSLIIKKLEGR